MPVDGTQGCIRAFTQLRKQYSKMKVILSIGGGGKGSENFAVVARYPSRAETFVRTARELVDRFFLDGVDSMYMCTCFDRTLLINVPVDWEHPSDPQQGRDYVNLLSRLRQGLPAPRYVISTCLPAGEWALQHIDLFTAQNYLDLINIMAYDFSGPWTSQTGHQSQLYSPEAEPSSTSCQAAVSYVLSRGVNPKKILLGVPAYGRSFLGSDNIGQSYTGHGGDDGTFDFCDLPRPGATEHHDEKSGAAYCTGGDGGFVTYDTPGTVQQKAKFVTQTRLGGMFYWHIGSDARGPRSLIETGYNTLHDM